VRRIFLNFAKICRENFILTKKKAVVKNAKTFHKNSSSLLATGYIFATLFAILRKIFVLDFHCNEKYNCREGFSAVFQDFFTNFLLFFVIAKMVFSGNIRFSRTPRKKSYHANSNRRCRRRRKNKKSWWRILTGNAVAPIPTTIPEYSGILCTE
jgi:hypothetical protein